MQAQPKWTYVVVFLIFLCGTAAVTVWLLNGGEVSLPGGRAAEEPKPRDTAEAEPDGQRAVRLQPGAVLVRLFDGMDGEVYTLPTEPVPEELIGKTELEVQEENPEWAVLDLAPDRLTVRVQLSEAAMATGTRYLGIHDGKLAIFRGKSGVVGELEEVTDIEVDWLPEYEQENLRRGQVFDDEELKLILESLAEAAEAARGERQAAPRNTGTGSSVR